MRRNALPYSRVTSGQNAFVEMEALLRRFGCANFGVMNNWAEGSVLVQFEYRGRQISVQGSWQGYAALWKKANPRSNKAKTTQAQYDQRARRAGEMAVPSMLRDWIKGQTVAVECGLMPFDHAFMAHMLLPDGSRLVEHAVKLLPAPT